MILYSTREGSEATPEYQVNSTGTSCGSSTGWASPAQSTPAAALRGYPEDYQIIEQLHKNRELTVRIAYNCFTQKPKGELADFKTGPACSPRGKVTITFATTAEGRCWSIRLRISRTFSNRAPISRLHGTGELKPVVSQLLGIEEALAIPPTCPYDETITRALNV